MKIFLIGATGRSGKWILKAALEHGHQVTALVRGGAARMTESHPSLRIETGDLLEISNLEYLMSGHDALISALDSRSVEAGSKRLIQAASGAGVNHYLAIAGGGILQLNETQLRRERPDYPAAFMKSSEGHLNVWQALQNSKLDWTLICTPDLLDQPATGKALHRAEYMPSTQRSIALGDVAEFIMDELIAPRYLCKRVGMTGS